MEAGFVEQIADRALGVLYNLKRPKNMIVGTALLAVFTVASAYITFKEIEKEFKR